MCKVSFAHHTVGFFASPKLKFLTCGRTLPLSFFYLIQPLLVLIRIEDVVVLIGYSDHRDSFQCSTALSIWMVEYQRSTR